MMVLFTVGVIIVVYIETSILGILLLMKLQDRQVDKELKAEGRTMHDNLKEMTSDARLANILRENRFFWYYLLPLLSLVRLFSRNDDSLL